MSIQKTLILSLLCLIGTAFAQTNHTNSETPSEQKEEFNPSETIVHHILDTHDWHLTDIPGKDENGNRIYHPVALHLPWFFYDQGFHFASGTEALLEKGYVPYHDHLYKLKPGVSTEEIHIAHGQVEHFDPETMADSDAHVIDLSVTKASLQMMIVGLLLLWVFISIAKAYQKRDGQAPKGIQSLFEPIILFVRDDIAKEYLGEKADKYTPYLLSLFFFIWFSNMFGLLPINSNIMGNISVTGALAVLSFILVQANGSKDYWRHIIAMPGVPVAIVPLMTIIEIISLFVKPFALAIRLFANISAGHFMILSLVSLIFIMGKNGESVGGALGIMPITVLFTLAIFSLEMIVAIIQAYIFTLLTAVFIGMARETHDDHH
ncbi:MAG: ATP synthase F0 subunit A [Bacteroidetes bacterium]|nr:MAG: ATP synthase F0 subunit A [Bacteroidota bacterium]